MSLHHRGQAWSSQSTAGSVTSVDHIGTSPLIAFVVGLEQLAWKTSTILMLDAVNKAAEARGTGLMLIVDTSTPSQALRNFAADGRVSGVLVRAQAADQRWVRELAQSVPTVMIGAHNEVQGPHVVEIENVESTASLVGSMLDAGCKRLAIVAGPGDRVDADDRMEGFRLAHVQRGLTVDPALVFPCTYRRQEAFVLTDSVLDAKPDGIFAANDEMARGVIERAGQRGVQIPEDLMVAGFDGAGDAAVASPDLATVRTPWDALGEIAVETLLGLISGIDMPLERLVDPEVHLGATVAPRGLSSLPAGAEHSINRVVPEGPV